MATESLLIDNKIKLDISLITQKKSDHTGKTLLTLHVAENEWKKYPKLRQVLGDLDYSEISGASNPGAPVVYDGILYQARNTLLVLGISIEEVKEFFRSKGFTLTEKSMLSAVS